jgi:hypothetical protein
VLSAAAAGTAFGLSKSLEIISPASAQQGEAAAVAVEIRRAAPPSSQA